MQQPQTVEKNLSIDQENGSKRIREIRSKQLKKSALFRPADSVAFFPG